MREEIEKNQQNEPEVLAKNYSESSDQPASAMQNKTSEGQKPAEEIKLNDDPEANSQKPEDDNHEETSPVEDGAQEKLPEPNDSASEQNTKNVSEPEAQEKDLQPEPMEKQPEATSTEHKDPVNATENSEETTATTGSEKEEASNIEKSSEAVKSETENTTTTAADADQQDEDEESHDEDLHEEKQVDYESFSKKQLTEAAEALLNESEITKADKGLKEIKPYFDEIENEAYASALAKFKQDGGDEADFHYRPDKLAIRFQQVYQTIRERKSKFQRELNQQKDDNLIAKQELLTKLRELIDSEETTQSIDDLKNLQKQWRTIGPVPGNMNKSIWASYNALINLYYDNRSIYFELKELDRKKNLEAKLAICEKAENLVKEENLKTAVKELDALHEEFKHIGPVPKEDQEPLWERFKTASDKIHARRREFVEGQKESLFENLEKKKKLCQAIKPFAEFQSDSIREWNEKTSEIKEVQTEWEKIGNMPREHAKTVNKDFWSGFKKFFNNKGQFYKKLDSMREENLKKKQDLVEKAQQLKDSTNWQQTADELKKLQQEWREVGPVPDKFKDKVYNQFKAACDEFFNNRRASFRQEEKEYEVNLEAKKKICQQIEQLSKEDPDDIDTLLELGEQFQEIGFVPKNSIKSIQKEFNDAVDKMLKASNNLDDDERQTIKYNLQFLKLKNSPNAKRKLGNRENSLRKQISKLQDDIALWRNNLNFFASSKKADKLKADFEKKIEEADSEVQALKEQLRILHNLEE